MWLVLPACPARWTLVVVRARRAVRRVAMSYVERLIAGYEAGLACEGVPPTAEELRELLAESVDAMERGGLLGMLARVTVADEIEPL